MLPFIPLDPLLCVFFLIAFSIPRINSKLSREARIYIFEVEEGSFFFSIVRSASFFFQQLGRI